MDIYAIVLAAGKGTRLNSKIPKVLHEVLYKPMILHIVDTLKCTKVTKSLIVVGHQAEHVKEVVGNEVDYIEQLQLLGTGHAVMQASNLLQDKPGITLVLNGDAPLITSDTINNIIEIHQKNHHHVTLVSAHCDEKKHYGRIIRDNQGHVKKIVEYKDATDQERKISEMNTGVYCFDNIELFKALKQIKNDNVQEEYYLTDVISIMYEHQLKVASYVIDDFEEVGGVNDRIDLYHSTKKLQERLNYQHMINGVTIIDVDSTYIGPDVTIGKDTIIEPGTIIKGKSVIGENCHLGPHCEFDHVTIKDNVEIKFSVISDSIVESGTDIGPYARLRQNCHIQENVHIGNFVEMKKSVFGVGSKCAHLSYIGDSDVGKSVNIGCGTITSNYDGKNKFKTIIKDHVFIGCNSNLIAPVTIENDSYVAAGSTITKDVAKDDFAIARAYQVNKTGYAKVLKEKQEGRK